MKMLRNISVITLITTASYFWGCSGSDKPKDKYDLIKSSDRKILKSVCKCIEPLTPFIKRLGEVKDSVEAQRLDDSLVILSMKLEPCMEDIDKLESKFENEKYSLQFLGYIQEYHPDCSVFFLGTKDSVKEYK